VPHAPAQAPLPPADVAPPVKVGTIYIIGNEFTRQPVILRQLPEGLLPGQPLRFPELPVAERNLAGLGIFDTDPATGQGPSVEVIERQGDQEYKDLLVKVHEARTTGLLLGAEVNSDASLTGSIVFDEKNFDITHFPSSLNDFATGHAFRGGGQELKLEATPGTIAQRYVAMWREPFLFDRPLDLLISAYYRGRDYDQYAETRLGSTIVLAHKLRPDWIVEGKVRVEDVGVHDVPPWDAPDYLSVVGNHFLLGLAAQAVHDTRDSLVWPTEGSVLRLSFEEVTGQFTFPVVGVDYRRYWGLFPRPDGSDRHVLIYHGQVMWEGSEAPVYERFFAGGLGLRGFEFRGVSPVYNGPPNQNGINADGVPVGGMFLLLNSLEYQIPVFANEYLRLYLSAFVDSGTVEPRLQIKDYRVAAGAGIRVLVPALGSVPMAIDFGFPIVEGPGDKEQLVSFRFGFSR
jgi:outer membrane protein assembly factor BamA